MTGNEMVAAVGGIMDIDIDGSSVPSTTQVTLWLNMGQSFLLKNLSPGALHSVWVEREYDDPGMLTPEIMADCFKVIAVRDTAVPDTSWDYVTPDMFYRVRNAGSLSAGKGIWTYIANSTGGTSEVDLYPKDSTTPEITVLYVKRPEEITATDAKVDGTLPIEYDDLLITYAVGLAKFQDDESLQGQYFISITGAAMGGAPPVSQGGGG